MSFVNVFTFSEWGFAVVVVSLCRDAAIVMLSGQVADGFATIFIGELVTPLLSETCLGVQATLFRPLGSL